MRRQLHASGVLGSLYLKTPNMRADDKLSFEFFPTSVPPFHPVPSGTAQCPLHTWPAEVTKMMSNWLLDACQVDREVFRVFVFMCGSRWGLVWKSCDRPTEHLTTSCSCRLTSWEMLWSRVACHSHAGRCGVLFVSVVSHLSLMIHISSSLSVTCVTKTICF